MSHYEANNSSELKTGWVGVVLPKNVFAAGGGLLGQVISVCLSEFTKSS